MARQWLRNEKGYLIRELTDEKVLAELNGEWQTAHEVADRLGCSISGAQKVLKLMASEGKIAALMKGKCWLYRTLQGYMKEGDSWRVVSTKGLEDQ